MRRFSPACAILLLAGCGVTGHVELSGPPAKVPAIAVTDSRPAADRTGGTRTGPAGRLHRFGDAALEPAPPALLARALAAHDAAVFAGRQVELQEFTVTVLDPAVRLPDGGDMATGAVTAGGVAAVLGYGVIAGIEHSRSRKTLTVRIAGTVDGRPFTAGRSAATRGRVTGRRLARLVGEALAEAAAGAAAVAAPPAPAMLTGG
jgi:hypothetical protein